jgi:hypothetical protein
MAVSLGGVAVGSFNRGGVGEVPSSVAGLNKTRYVI